MQMTNVCSFLAVNTPKSGTSRDRRPNRHGGARAQRVVIGHLAVVHEHSVL